MPNSAIDPLTLHRNLIHLLQHGMRTSTYKLATMSAIIDYSVKHCPANAAAELQVPISELARRVIDLYWGQAEPFDGTQLRQSTSPQSRIVDSIKAVRSAAGCRGPGVSLDIASQLAPGIHRRAISDVGLCLAQQPLPRLQRLPGSAKSVPFLYDDSFLHDKVSLTELQRCNNAIRLYPGVAHGLAALESPLAGTLQTMWVDDVLRLNRLAAEQRQRLEQHLFGSALSPGPMTVVQPSPVEEAVEPTVSANRNDGGLATATLAARLNQLLAKNRKPDGEPYSSGELAAKIRESGLPMTVTAISQLRAGVGPAPSEQVVGALAKFFGVTPAFLVEGAGVQSLAGTFPSSPRRQSTASAEVPKSSTATSGSAAGPPRVNGTSPSRSPVSAGLPDDSTWGRVIGPDLEDVAVACRIQPNGCWVAPSQSPVRCRPLDDTRGPLELPKLPLHRWAWMIANDLTTRAIPTYLIQIRRSCAERRCCNPEHLIAAAPGGEELTPGEVASLLGKSYVSSPESDRRPPPVQRRGLGPAVRPPLTDDLGFISAYCQLDAASGCWIAPTTSAVTCRAAGDHRPERDLPKLKAHRWAWMVAHGRSSEPLPGDLFQVWRHCENARCCNPDHLYLTDPDGEEASVEDAEEWLRSVGTRREDAAVAGPSPGRDSRIHHSGRVDDSSRPAWVGGRHRAPAPDAADLAVVEYDTRTAVSDHRLFADRLNALFEGHWRSDGVPPTSADVAAVLQADGIALSENLIDQLRAGSGGPPAARTIDALAYYFNVDADYFSAAGHSVDVRKCALAAAQPSPPATATAVSSPTMVEAALTQDVSMPIDEIGSVMGGLAEAISECLARSPADTGRSARMAPLIVELATLLATRSEQVTVGRPLLRRVHEEWTRAAGSHWVHRPILDRLSALIDD